MQWKYNDNFFGIGAIAIRYNEIPSIRIHIKFDGDALFKAEKLNMALHFKRVFIEQCPTYRKYQGAHCCSYEEPDLDADLAELYTTVIVMFLLSVNRISTVNLLTHNHAYGLLPINLLSLISSSENIYSGLDDIEKRFQSAIAKVNEFDAITDEHNTLVRMESDG